MNLINRPSGWWITEFFYMPIVHNSIRPPFVHLLSRYNT